MLLMFTFKVARHFVAIKKECWLIISRNLHNIINILDRITWNLMNLWKTLFQNLELIYLKGLRNCISRVIHLMSAFSTDSFGKLLFCVFLFSACSCQTLCKLDNICIIIVYIVGDYGVRYSMFCSHLLLRNDL